MINYKKKLFHINKLIFTIFIIIISSISIIAETEYNEKNDSVFSITYFFNDPYVEKLKVGEKTYDKIIIDGIINSANPGEPYLPTKGVYILLPNNKEVKQINIISSQKKSLGSDFLILPASKPIPISVSISSFGKIRYLTRISAPFSPVF